MQQRKCRFKTILLIWRAVDGIGDGEIYAVDGHSGTVSVHTPLRTPHGLSVNPFLSSENQVICRVKGSLCPLGFSWKSRPGFPMSSAICRVVALSVLLLPPSFVCATVWLLLLRQSLPETFVPFHRLPRTYSHALVTMLSFVLILWCCCWWRWVNVVGARVHIVELSAVRCSFAPREGCLQNFKPQSWLLPNQSRLALVCADGWQLEFSPPRWMGHNVLVWVSRWTGCVDLCKQWHLKGARCHVWHSKSELKLPGEKKGVGRQCRSQKILSPFLEILNLRSKKIFSALKSRGESQVTKNLQDRVLSLGILV